MDSIIKAVLLLFLIFIINVGLKGQILPMHHYSMEDGLVADDINAFCQDSSGYIWIATSEGLSVFNSKGFNNYTVEDGLPTNNISVVTTDLSNGNNIWIGTVGKGVVEYVDGKFIRFADSHNKKNNIINCLLMDKSKNLWCGTENSIFLIKNDKVTLLPNPLHIGEVNSLSEDDEGNILIGSSDGFFKYNPFKKKFVKINTSLSSNSKIVSVNYTKNGSTLLLTSKGKLLEINSENEKSISLSSIGEFKRIFTSTLNNYYWIASDHGLFKINLKKFQKIGYYTQKNGLPGNNINCVFNDREGVLWVGTNGRGISKLVHSNILKFNIPEAKINVYNISTVIDKNNHVWAATSDRLLELWKDDNLKWHIYNHTEIGAKVNHFIAKLFLSGGSNLIVTYSEGNIKEFSIVNHKPQSKYPSKLILNSSIDLSKKYKFYGLFITLKDNANRLWVSALDLGVIVLNNSKPRQVIKIYTEKDGLPDNSIRCIYQDKHGNYWFGGYSKGLTYFSKDKVLKDLGLNYSSSNVKITKYSNKQGLPDNSIRAITEDNRGSIYIGTRYGGLAILKKGKFKIFSKTNGLFSNGIWDISFTSEFGIWLATQAGIQKLNANGTISYDIINEIPRIPFYSISVLAGKFIFANPTELFIYEAGESHLKKIRPSVFINRILVNGQKISMKKKLEFTNIQNNITFDFIDISNIEGHNRAYEYRLLSEDKKWNKIINRSSITYASLNPGTYTFQVIAISPDGLKSIKPAEIKFTIDAPFYEKWWFDLIVILIIVSIITAAVRMRVKRLLEIERVRSKIAEELHDDIGSGLTKIAILSEHALFEKSGGERKSGNGKSHSHQNKSIVKVGTIARNLVDQMVDVIWSIDPQYDKLEDFIIHFKNYAYEVCEAKNIELIIETKNIKNVKLDPQIKRKLHLISTEALNNSLKHSGCSKIYYQLSVKDKIIKLEIGDDGKGIPQEKFGSGNGLINMQKYIQELKGLIDFDSDKHNGTIIKIEIPIH